MTTIDAPFPSPAWFVELVSRATADPTVLERLGIADLRFGMEILTPEGTAHLYGLVLDGYDICVVGPTSETSLAADVIVSGPVEAWKDMIDWIEEHGPADAAHSLNGMTIAGVPLEARSDDAMGSDKFYRFMGTLQAIFDAAGVPVASRTAG
jgi:hypothetical protein